MIPPLSSPFASANPTQMSPGPESARTAAEGLYSQLVYQMLQEAQKTVPEGGLAGLGEGGDTFMSMLHMEIADRVAAQDQGIVPEIKRAISPSIR